MSKLETLARSEGYADSMDMLEAQGFDSVVPGICRNPDCDYTVGVEHDTTDNWCEECEEGTVESCLILAGMI